MSARDLWDQVPGYFEHTFEAFDLSGAPITDLNTILRQDTLVIGGGLGIPAPSAFRIVNASLVGGSSVPGDATLTLTTARSQDAGVTYPLGGAPNLVVNMAGTLAAPAQTTGQLNIVVEPGEVWKPEFSIATVGYVVPIFRLVLGCERLA